ncbi:MAG: hypothetical protein AAB490_02625 [Patescibacteria group bacterium]
MSTMVRSIEEGKALAAMMAGVDPATTTFVEDPELRVEPIWMELKKAGDPTAEELRAMEEELALQQGFRFKNSDGVEVAIVIDRFRDGYSVWGITPKVGAVRF